MQLLQETITDIVTESVLDESTNTKKTYIEGITLVAETVMETNAVILNLY